MSPMHTVHVFYDRGASVHSFVIEEDAIRFFNLVASGTAPNETCIQVAVLMLGGQFVNSYQKL